MRAKIRDRRWNRRTLSRLLHCRDKHLLYQQFHEELNVNQVLEKKHFYITFSFLLRRVFFVSCSGSLLRCDTYLTLYFVIVMFLFTVA